MRRIDHYWYSQNPVAWLMLPLSWLFCTVALLRRMLYRSRILASYSVPAPVVIVGNISVGGTGKTPLLIALCEYLARRDYKPGVVSRGYGSAVDGEYSLSVDDDAGVCGDEPLLIRQRTNCPVVIGRNRVEAARKLLAENDCDVILSDDGLQHYRLNRDIEIAVVDAQRRFGNGFCLPAGPLREPVWRLKQTDMVVHHGDAGERFNFSLRFGDAVNLCTQDRRNLESFAGTRVHALAGIGHPDRFFAQLRSHGLDVNEHAFPDHHQYAVSDLDFPDGAPVLMTEKDAVKCRPLLDKAGARCDNAEFWSVPVDAIMSDPLGSGLVELISRKQ